MRYGVVMYTRITLPTLIESDQWSEAIRIGIQASLTR
jgi:hypothetical protein